MTKNELEKSLLKMIDDDKLIHTLIIDGVASEEDKSPVYSFVKKLMGSIDNIDVIKPTHEKKNLISVEEVGLQIVENAYLKPYASGHKVYLIDADLLNVAGQNKLLKILEEPPVYAIFILFVRNISSLLPTVKSRAVVMSLTDGTVTYDIEVEDKKMILEGASRFAKMDGLDAVSFAKSIVAIVKNESATYEEIFDIIKKLYRDAILICENSNLSPMIADGVTYAEALAKLGEENLLKNISVIEKTEKEINNGNSPAVNPENALCLMILDMRVE